MLLSLRDCVLRPTKRMIFERGVAESTVRIKKTEDDYDYPETLRIVGLDRTRANDARAAPAPSMRLDSSIFGQLFAALSGIEPAWLCIRYTHPMDDGQNRTFKVKFLGEGVDDYGGPYREVFSQLALSQAATTYLF